MIAFLLALAALICFILALAGVGAGIDLVVLGFVFVAGYLLVSSAPWRD